MKRQQTFSQKLLSSSAYIWPYVWRPCILKTTISSKEFLVYLNQWSSSYDTYLNDTEEKKGKIFKDRTELHLKILFYFCLFTILLLQVHLNVLPFTYKNNDKSFFLPTKECWVTSSLETTPERYKSWSFLVSSLKIHIKVLKFNVEVKKDKYLPKKNQSI